MGCGGPLGATATAHETRKTVTALFCDLVGDQTGDLVCELGVEDPSPGSAGATLRSGGGPIRHDG